MKARWHRSAESVNRLGVCLDRWFGQYPKHTPLGQAFSPLRYRDGRVTLQPWVQGKPSSGEAVAEQCGALLAAMHRLRPPGLSDGRWQARPWQTPDARIQSLGRLHAAGVFDNCSYRAWQHQLQLPLSSEGEVLIHADLAPDNIIVDAEQRVRIVDDESLTKGPAEYDLARTWWRWSGSGQERRTLFLSYLQHTKPTTLNVEKLACWCAYVAIEAVDYRVQLGIPLQAGSMTRLRALENSLLRPLTLEELCEI